MSEKLIAVDGAEIYCPQAIGNASSCLVGTNSTELSGCSNCILTEYDSLPGENILPFATGCKILGTCMPTPKLSAKNGIWNNTGEGLTNTEERVLLENSFFTCQVGGVKVEILQPNQDTIMTIATSNDDDDDEDIEIGGLTGKQKKNRRKKARNKSKRTEKGHRSTKKGSRKKLEPKHQKGDKRRQEDQKRKARREANNNNKKKNRKNNRNRRSRIDWNVIGAVVATVVVVGIVAAVAIAAGTAAAPVLLGAAAVVAVVGIAASLFSRNKENDPPDFA